MALKLAAPWTTYYRLVQSFFKNDPEVGVVFDEEDVELKIYVNNQIKAEALAHLLPESQTFGNVVLKVTIIPSMEGILPALDTDIDIIRAALDGNGAVVDFYPVEYIFSNSMLYVSFKKEVIQFFNDDLSDIRGMCSTLYANIAKELFGTLKGVFFCTDSENAKFGMPLGEWP